MDLGKQSSSGEPPEPAPLPVIVSSDGSVVIDGVPVPLVGGEAVDVAILDTLHGYARSRDSAVRAAISDPSADYVAIVQVEPDGSSRLVEQRQEGADADLRTRADAGFTGEEGPPEGAGPVGTAQFPVDSPKDPGPTGITHVGDTGTAVTDDGGSGGPELVGPRASVPPRTPGPGSGRRKLLSQSDDEYQPPGFFRRPLGVVVVGVVATAVVTVPLLVLGTSGSAGQHDAAAGSTGVQVEDKAPSSTPASPSARASADAVSRRPSSASATASPKSKSKSKESAKPEDSAQPEDSAKPKGSAASEPTSRPGTRTGSGVPSGDRLIKNEKYGFCLDLPGTGKSKPNTLVQDGACRASSGDNQKWALERVADGGGTREADLYLIHHVKSGLCLDLYGDGPAQVASPAGLFGCNSSTVDNQLWWLDERSDGTYWIRNQASGDMCLDLSRKNKEAAHGGVTVYPCSDLDDHEWSFAKK
ncbi:RICIN domain-containing protein [Streptomyces sp. enrichment culture]|uniref:RICIN domain-containing protein n=1 Tax=Streptomyces sp. enrichment culture TaxID=1795815 RepID=UPI003F55EB04